VKFAKWIGGALGWAFGGPLGAVFGFILGSALDGSSRPMGQYRAGSTTQGDFKMALLALLAAVMKADGKHKKSELNFIKDSFTQMFGYSDAREAMPMLKELLKQDIPVRDICDQVKRHMDHPARLELFHLLFALALADNHFDPAEERLLKSMASYMNISDKDFNSIKAMFVPDTDSAYKILEVSPNASDDEVRKAYRRMAMKYHPDRVAHLGEDVVKSANEKFQSVNKAWNDIKKQRGIL
jgi:DnaJ like chaperone protein